MFLSVNDNLSKIFVKNIYLVRYDEYGEGRGSASNSDQTGTLSRTSYHSSDPDHYPDLLDIPGQRVKQQSASPASR